MTRIRLRDASNALQTVKQIRVRDENNATQIVRRIRLRDSINSNRTVWSALEVTISPSPVAGFSALGGTVNVDTSSVTAAPVNGVGPYTYVWTAVGSSPYTWVISAPFAAVTFFTAQALPEGAYAENDFQVTVTDANGATAIATVLATARNKYDIVIERTSSGRFQ